MEFRSILTEDTKEYISNSGSPVLQEYEYSFDKAGHKMLKKKDSVINVYERIQVDKDSCDINRLMERFALGDTEALNINKGVYLDATKLPTTMAEVFAKGLEAEQYFNGLPVEVKELFDNSHSVFFTEMGTMAFDSKIKAYNERFENHQFEDKSTGEDVKERNYNE